MAPPPGASPTSARPWLIALALAVLLALAGAWWLAERGRQAEIQRVAAQSELIAASRAQALNQWIAEQRRAVTSLAENPSVQVYAVTLAGNADPLLIEGQGAYLRAFLTAAAERTGFLAGVSQVPANVPRGPAPGLALLAADGRLLVEVGGPLPLPDDLLAAAAQQPLIDGTRRVGAGPVLSLLMPVLAPETGKPIAYVYGVRLLDAGARALLVQPGEPLGTAEVALIATRGDQQLPVTSRAGLAEGSWAPLDPLAQAALAQPGRSVQGSGPGGKPALATAAPLEGVAWSLLRVAPAATTLGPIDARARLLFLSLAAAIAFIATAILLVWRHGTSVREARAARAAEAARDSEARMRRFLQLVADRQPTFIGVVQADGAISFTNARLGQTRALAQAFGPGATEVEALVAAAAADTASVPAALIADQTRRWQAQAVSLAPDSEGVLVVAEDVTELIAARERREADLRTLVSTLTGLIDARDPGSAHHSARVAATAAALAEALGLDTRSIETARTAGQLMNLGKIMVPRSVLTKQGALDPAERALVAQAFVRSADILAAVPFEGPVAQTIGQLGAPASGPDGQLARLVRLANAFVGMTSPRAHRAALPVDDALQALRRQAEADDQPIVSALAHWLDNQGGRSSLDQA